MNQNNKIIQAKNLIFAVAAIIVLIPYQNCARFESKSMETADFSSLSNQLIAGETYVPVSAPRKVDSITTGGQVAMSLVSALGVNGDRVAKVVNSSYAESTGYLPLILLSEYGTYDSVTPAHLNATSRVAQSACQQLVGVQELNLLKYDNVAKKIVDDRRHFRGILMGTETSAVTLRTYLDASQNTGEVVSNLHPDGAYSADVRYINSIRSLARALWGREATEAEISLILQKVKALQALPANAANARIGYRSAIFICTSMASTFDSLRR